jgi:hypothetical protein
MAGAGLNPPRPVREASALAEGHPSEEGIFPEVHHLIPL